MSIDTAATTRRGPAIDVEVDPAEVGFSSERLERLTRHVRGYVDDGRLAGASVLVARHGKVAALDTHGRRDLEHDLPMEPDTIHRIYSMTKPIASLALMQLYEQGRFKLTDPVERYLPAFADMQVVTGGSLTRPVLRPASGPITVHHLLTHMSGLTYGFMQARVADALYRQSPLEQLDRRAMSTAEVIEHLAALPLLADPGVEWNYSMSTDVVGHLVEVLSGQRLDVYLEEHVLGPLGMVDTGFSVPPDATERLASCYTLAPGDTEIALLDAAATSPYLEHPAFLSGGGGLVSTMHDYHRFCLALLRGGALDGRRVIGPRTLAYMTTNHLPGGRDLVSCGTPLFSETPYDGVGFGLGFSVQLDPATTRVISSPGEFGWGGMASTVFFCDPVEDLHVILMTQLMPSSAYPIRPELKALVHQAIVD